jgi:hypothetical protein
MRQWFRAFQASKVGARQLAAGAAGAALVLVAGTESRPGAWLVLPALACLVLLYLTGRRLRAR